MEKRNQEENIQLIQQKKLNWLSFVLLLYLLGSNIGLMQSFLAAVCWDVSPAFPALSC